METFFKRRTRPRQSSASLAQDLGERSVPYNQLAPPKTMPVTVSTASHGIRNPGAVISAPITNPTLTSNGTEINKFNQGRQRTERERAYLDAGITLFPPGSPSTSVSTADSSTLYGDSEIPSNKHTTRAFRQSGSGSSLTDFGVPSPTSPTSRHRTLMPDHNATIRPTSTMTTSTSRSDKLTSLYSGLTSPEYSSKHLSTLSQHLSRLNPSEEFFFPRPNDDNEIQAMFDEVIRKRDIPKMPVMSAEQMWSVVYNDAHMAWKDLRTQEQQARTGHPGQPTQGTPQWYIKKFLDKTITPKQATGLEVTLRTGQMQ